MGITFNGKYFEIFKLKRWLEKTKIPFGFREWDGGYQIGYPVLPPDTSYICSVIETDHSYGHDDDLLEIRGLLTDEEYQEDSVLGHLNAEEVFERIRKHYFTANILIDGVYRDICNLGKKHNVVVNITKEDGYLPGIHRVYIEKVGYDYRKGYTFTCMNELSYRRALDIYADIEKAIDDVITQAKIYDETFMRYKPPYRPDLSCHLAYKTRKQAEDVLRTLRIIVNTYGCATIADLKDLMDLPTTWEDCKYGWIAISPNTKIYRKETLTLPNEPYRIGFPTPILLDSECKKCKDESEDKVDIHKIIDDAIAKKDRSVSIFITESGVSTHIEPLSEPAKWEHDYSCSFRTFKCPECGYVSVNQSAYCPECGEKLGKAE